jgi:hypothetical protein
MPCQSCQQKRAAALKASPTRQAYTPAKSGQRIISRGTSSYGTPKVRMSFGRRK